MPEVLLLGSPVSHSLSPVFQNAGFRAAGLSDWVYSAREVAAAGVASCCQRVRRGELAGANITLPHKQLALEHADQATSEAAAMGAANTWSRDRRGRVVAYNTDVVGIERTLMALSCRPRNVLVLGAGGSARAAVWACLGIAERVTLVSRRREQGLEIATASLRWPQSGTCGALGWGTDSQSRSDLQQAVTEADLIINATPNQPSLEPVMGGFPWSMVHPMAWVFDLSYGRQATVCVRHATAAGCQAVDGALMLVEQGAASFELWTARTAPRDVMALALAQALGRSDLLRIPA